MDLRSHHCINNVLLPGAVDREFVYIELGNLLPSLRPLPPSLWPSPLPPTLPSSMTPGTQGNLPQLVTISWPSFEDRPAAQRSPPPPSTSQHSIAQHSAAQHSTAEHRRDTGVAEESGRQLVEKSPEAQRQRHERFRSAGRGSSGAAEHQVNSFSPLICLPIFIFHFNFLYLFPARGAPLEA